MHILSVRLKNFKIHADAFFEFEPGINAICGENGAGKTSLLEAIAWVLFDHCNYKNEELIRAGASAAEVGVQFISQFDQRTYEVRRHTQQGYRLYDPQLHQQLEYERKGDVLSWLRQHLGVSAGTDLSGLFRTAVGVPQGTFTADFLRTAGERKKVFDIMLKVEEYKATGDDLKDLEHYGKEQRDRTAHQIELALVTLQDQPAFQSQFTEITATLAQHNLDLVQQQHRQVTLSQEWEALEALVGQIATVRQQVQGLEQEGSLADLRCQQAHQEWQKACQAQIEQQTYADDFGAYGQADLALRNLVVQQQERQPVLKQRENLITAGQDEQQQITRLRTQLEHLHRLTIRQQELAALQQQQETLEAQLQEWGQILDQHQTLAQAIHVQTTQRDALTQQIAQVRQTLEETQTAAQIHQASQPGHLAFIQAEEELARYQGQLPARAVLLTQREDRRQTLMHLAREEATLQEQLHRRQTLLAQMAHLEPLVEQQSKAEARLHELGQRLQRSQMLRVRVTEQEALAAQLAEDIQITVNALTERESLLPQVQMIPIWETQQERARLYRSRVAAAQQFQDELQQIVATAQQQGQDLDQQTTAIQAVLNRYPQLQPPIQALVAQGSQALQTVIVRLQTILTDLEQQTDTTVLDQQLATLTTQLQAAYQAQRLTDQLADWQAKYHHQTQQQQALAETIADLHWQLDSDTSDRRQYEEVERQLQEWGDPRNHLKRCQEDHRRTEGLETAWQELQQRLAHHQGSLAEIEERLQPWQDLEQQIEAWQQRRQQYQGSHQTFLTTQKLAASVEQRQQEYHTLEAQQQSLQQELVHLQQHQETLTRTWGSHTVLSQRQQTVQEQWRQLGDPRRQQQQIQQELAQQSGLEEQLRQLEAQGANRHQAIAVLEAQLETTADLDQKIQAQHALLEQLRPSYQRYMAAESLAVTLPACETRWQQAQAHLTALTSQRQQLAEQLTPLLNAYNSEHHQRLQGSRHEVALDIMRLQTSLSVLTPQQEELSRRLQDLEKVAEQHQQQEQTLKQQERLQRFVKYLRTVYKEAGPRITGLYLRQINQVADHLFREILNRPDVSLSWESDYDIVVQEGANRRRFAMLSGGEQMIAALSVRLALLKTIEEINIAFFDEPTTNIDRQRRIKLAESISNIRSFQQLFVISHDDSFEQITGHILHLERSLSPQIQD